MFVVGVAYWLSSDWAVEPLDGVATLGSMILSVFLIYIYQRQNRILERQQEIMESEEEISEASQVAPNIHVDWSLKQDGSLEMDITNTGADDAYHVTVHTELEVLDDGLDVETSEWSCEAFRRVATGTDQDFVWEEEVLYDASINGGRSIRNFPGITQELMSAGRDEGIDSVGLRVLIWLSFEDIRGNTDVIELFDSNFEIDGRMALSTSPNSEVEPRTLVPRIRIVDTGVFKHFSGVEYFGVEFESVGGSAVTDFSVVSEVEVFDGSEWVSSDRFGFSGCELEYSRDKRVLQGEFLFEWFGGEEEDSDVEMLFFEKLSGRLLDRGFDNRVLIRFRVQYVDATGNSGADAVDLLGEVDFETGSDVLSDDVPVVSEPCSLYDIL